MNTENIVASLGQSYESPAVQEVVKELGSTKPPKPKKDDPVAYLAAKSVGIELMFADSDYLERKPVVRFGNAPMVLVAATLYSGRQTGDPSMRRFMHVLPAGTTFDDPVDALLEKLGPPDRIYEDEGVVYTRTWMRGACRLVFKYNDSGTVQYVQLSWDPYMKRVAEG